VEPLDHVQIVDGGVRAMRGSGRSWPLARRPASSMGGAGRGARAGCRGRRRPALAAALAWLCLSSASPAAAGARIQVIATDPASPAVLGAWHRFSVRISYVADEPIRVRGETFSKGRKVTSATSGSPVYAPGTGEGMFWFAYTEAALVDRIVLTAYAERGEAHLAEAALDVRLRWTGERTGPPASAEWVQRMDAEAERRHREAHAAYMNRPTPAWQWVPLLALMWSPLAYLVAQIVVPRGVSGRWRAAALAPLAPMAIVLLYTVAAYRAGSNLFPLVLIFTSPVAFLYLVVLAVLHRSLPSART
jgi:hypothetical protein